MNGDKKVQLDNILKELKSFVIAFSGGVDSSFLMHRARSIKKLEYTGVTIRTPYIPKSEIDEAAEFARTYDINHVILDITFPESIRNNPEERCYICKKALFTELLRYAENNGYKYVVEGTNADDPSTHRPGLRALGELDIRSPLMEAGLTKKEIREYLRQDGLSIWDKPAMACLLTRIPYNTRITEESLGMVERAEGFLLERGYPGTRVRIHGDLARIECLPGYFERIIQDPEKENIINNLKKIGFRYISLDLEGYRSGSSDQKIIKI